jgi:hypothetical protein
MRLADGELEDAPLGGWAGELSAPVPTPTVETPAVRFPAPDWDAEERERRARRAAEIFDENAEDTEPYPAPKGHRAKGES